MLEKYKIQYKDFLKRFKLIRHEKSVSIGEYVLMKDMQTRKNVFVKIHQTQPYSENNISQFQDFDHQPHSRQIFDLDHDQEVQNTLEKAIQLNDNQNIIRFIGYSTSSPPHSDFNQLFVIYETSEQRLTLEQSMNKIIQKKDEYEERFLWVFLENMVSALAFLERKGLSHGDLHPRNISLFKGDLDPQFKLFYSSYTISSYDQIISFQEPTGNYYLSPEQMDSLGRYIDNELYDKTKSDVFALGYILLNMGSISHPQKIYRITDYTLNMETLDKKMVFFKQIYTKQLYTILEKMLELDPNERPSFISLKQFIQKTNQSGYVSPPKSQITLNKKKPKNLLTPERSNRRSNMKASPSVYQGSSGQDLKNQSGSTRNTSNKQFKFNPNEFEAPDQQASDRNPIFDKLQENLRHELSQQRERRQKSIDSRIRSPTRSQRSPSSSIRGSVYGQPIANSPYKRQTLSPLKKAKKKPIQSPQSLHRMHTIELEKDLIYDQNGNLKEGMEKKNYVDGSLYMGQVSDDQREGIGIYYYQSGEVYAGEWRNNLLSGKGRYIFSNGEMYEGQIVQGKKEGKGVYKYYNNNVYNGEWKGDKKEGHGNYKYEDKGEEYTGEFQDGLKHGRGQYTFSNGDIFDGHWKNGQKHGQGSVQFVNGSKFDGDWHNDQPTGTGRLLYSNGDVYEGSFSCGIKEGEGIYLHQNSNSRYQGQWDKDQPSGYGQFYFSSGDIYEGEMKDGMRQGKGIYTYENGDTYKGQWLNDQKHGKGILTYQDGTEYNGEWHNNQMQGQGKIIYDNTDSYEGEWLKDKKQGQGTYKWAMGGQYQGNWYRDKMNGYGVYTSPSGEKIEGQWRDNQYLDDQE